MINAAPIPKLLSVLRAEKRKRVMTIHAMIIGNIY